jgi:hypothetical protein
LDVVRKFPVELLRIMEYCAKKSKKMMQKKYGRFNMWLKGLEFNDEHSFLTNKLYKEIMNKIETIGGRK